ncbi:hypothetical protein BDU57DRAFT_558579 [Ampelomyces quisqualis]|uniref:Delta(24)-sterol reductase n=1 Tax=Ampelomyces quisqualis TaxID=50730 RepID=A0A6A5QD97_AMPQU|nr:hypothetical protein BDU57DRAFT_558579 [Ampelomyces quisqualis]
MDGYTLEEHGSAVREVAAKVLQFHLAQVPFRINHGSTNSTRRREPETPELCIAHLNHILDIDVSTQTAIVEPNVPLDALVSRCLPRGLMPLVVMEFPGITVGGGLSGASGESTGWREGLFDCSINHDLFDGARCTLGTLGVITLLKVRLTAAGDAVKLIHRHTKSVNETIELLAKMCNDDKAAFDFIEALQYNMEHGVIITGKHLASTAAEFKGLPRQRFDRATDPWFYMHAESTPEGFTEIVPTQSYLFRHDRGAFWSGEVFLKYYKLPNNRFVRWLINPLTTARAIYRAMLATNTADGAVIQDLLLPVETSEAFVDYVDKELNIWPLWICPIRKKRTREGIVGWPFYKTESSTATTTEPNATNPAHLNPKGDLTFNFGVWGPTDPTPAAVRKTNRNLEQKLRELRGMKVPYAANFYTEEEFWAQYDRPKYEQLRKKWHAEALPNMYDKVRRKKQDVDNDAADKEPEKLTFADKILRVWPIGGLYQTYCVVFR